MGWQQRLRAPVKALRLNLQVLDGLRHGSRVGSAAARVLSVRAVGQRTENAHLIYDATIATSHLRRGTSEEAELHILWRSEQIYMSGYTHAAIPIQT